MEKKKKSLIEEIEQTLDKKLTVAEMYANRPRKWVLYLAIVLLIVVMEQERKSFLSCFLYFVPSICLLSHHFCFSLRKNSDT